jgi:aspartate kinase
VNVFKFGGASLKTPAAIRNVADIIKKFGGHQLLVVVSAMGTTTNALEKVIELSQHAKDPRKELKEIEEYHTQIISSLLHQPEAVLQKLKSLLLEIEVKAASKGEYDFVYDQVIGYGEIISSVIVAEFLRQEGIACQWLDARNYIQTDSSFREGKIDWTLTQANVKKLDPSHIYIVQGFIGTNTNGDTVSLGREGSDFTAAIFGFCLNAQSVTIWKDVPGVMSADPKRLPHAIVFEELPYKEAAEMTYYGASVIHPKTIKPLANKGIPLFVKSFVDPSLPGTKIHACIVDKLPPLFVFKGNQCLVSCKVTDYTFINEEQLGVIFRSITECGIHVNVMQNSAISFSFCCDFRESKIFKLINLLSKHFEVYYNAGLTLITIKNYDAKSYNEYRSKKGVILEQSSRSTLQLLTKEG